MLPPGSTWRACVVAVVLEAAALHFLERLDRLEVESLLVDDVAVAVAHRDDLAAELVDLLQRVDGDVAGAGDDGLHPLEALLLAFQHLLDEVGAAVAGRLVRTWLPP
jgi:hypothetical protein